MCQRITIVYNKPGTSRYDRVDEQSAVLGVMHSVKAVHHSLLELGYQVSEVPLELPIEQARGTIASLQTDLLFNLFEGFCGFPETEALVPEIAAAAGIPYTGCNGKELRLAVNKARVKELLKQGGIPTPEYQVVSRDTFLSFTLRFPCIVKPLGEDASHGLTESSVVNDMASLNEQLSRLARYYGKEVLIEEFIDGREFNITVMGDTPNKILPVSEIVYYLPDGFPHILTFTAKWDKESLYYRKIKVVCPAIISEQEHNCIKQTALNAWRLLDCQGIARVDMRMDQNGCLNVLEINPNPDISPDAGAARQAAAAGLTYTGFIERLVQLAMEKGNEHRNSSRTQA